MMHSEGQGEPVAVVELKRWVAHAPTMPSTPLVVDFDSVDKVAHSRAPREVQKRLVLVNSVLPLPSSKVAGAATEKLVNEF